MRPRWSIARPMGVMMSGSDANRLISSRASLTVGVLIVAPTPRLGIKQANSAIANANRRGVMRGMLRMQRRMSMFWRVDSGSV